MVNRVRFESKNPKLPIELGFDLIYFDANIILILKLLK